MRFSRLLGNAIEEFFKDQFSPITKAMLEATIASLLAYSILSKKKVKVNKATPRVSDRKSFTRSEDFIFPPSASHGPV